MELEPIKILFLAAPEMPHARRWIELLRASGHDLHVATLHVIPDWASRLSTPLRSRGDVSRPSSFRDICAAVPRLRRVLREVRPDVTIAYYMTSYGLLAALTRAPCVIGATAGGDVLVDPYDSVPHRIRNRFVLGISLRHAAKLLAWAPHVADRLQQLGVGRERIFIQVRGVDLGRFKHRRRDSTPTGILSLRQFKPLYDLPTLLRALSRLNRNGIPFRATLLGDGPDRGRLERLVVDLRLDGRVELPGTKDEDAVIEMLQTHDVYVSTSSTDGASAALFEAMATGAYPIVTDIAANRAWITPGVNGTLFPVGDDAALALAIERAIADPDRCRGAIEHNLALARQKLDFRRNMTRIEAEILHTWRSQKNRDARRGPIARCVG